MRRARTEPDDDTLPWARVPLAVATVVVAGVAAGLVAGGLAEQPSASELATGAQARRLTTVSSNRYEYWRVGLAAFADRPLTGLGAAGFRVRWLRERPIPEAVRDVHSIELEQAAELGLPGLLAFAVLLAGAFLAARAALRRDPAAAAGAAQPRSRWLLHASIDWDWQLPAVSLPAIVLARCAGGHRRALSGSSRRRSAAARSATASSRPRASNSSAPQAVTLSGSAPHDVLDRALRARRLAARAVQQRQPQIRRRVRIEQPRTSKVALGRRQRSRRAPGRSAAVPRSWSRRSRSITASQARTTTATAATPARAAVTGLPRSAAPRG